MRHLHPLIMTTSFKTNIRNREVASRTGIKRESDMNNQYDTFGRQTRLEFTGGPHANGGSRIARFKNGQISYDINDLLGTTLAVVSDTHLHLSPLTAFGKPKTVAPNPGTPAPLDAPVAPTTNPNLQQQQIRIK